ncbi:MAG: ABC transporter permease subunit [Actinobacteria bacterium]|nr:ABC transporter permease subunit [Actinomycetota bacterium]
MTAAVSSSKRRSRLPKFGLALPSFVWYTMFFVVPIAIVVVYSFAAKDSTKLIPVDLSDPSLQNYRDVLDPDGVFFTTFKATIRIALIATTLCVLIGFPVAYFVAFKVREKWRATLLALIVVPSFTSFLIRTVAWRIPLAPNGTLSGWLQDWGITDGPLQILETQTAVQLAIVYNYLGFMILPLFVALDRIDAGMREASKDLGAGRLATFFGVTLPLSAPGIAAGALLTYIPMCGDYVTATVLGGAKGNMIGAMVASQFTSARNWPLGSAMAVLMIIAVLLTLLVGVIVVWLVPRVVRMVSPHLAPVRARIYQRGLSAKATKSTGRRRPEVLKVVLAVWAILVLLFMFIPIGLVILHSFNSGGSFSIWAGGVSTEWWGALFRAEDTIAMLVRFAVIGVAGVVIPKVIHRATGRPSARAQRWIGLAAFVTAFVVNGIITDWYRTIFRDVNIGDAMRNSFTAAFGATVIAVIIGSLSGVALARRPGKWTVVFMALVFLILVTPEIMDAISLATWMEQLGGPFKNNIGPINFGLIRLWVGQSLYASAVVTLIVRARLAGLDESLEEAAGDLGATPATAFRQVTLPLIAPAVIAGALLSFTLCLDNTVISTLISAGGVSTFPVALLSATRSTIKPFWGVGSVVLFMVTMAALGFVAAVLRRSGDSSSQIAATMTGS